MYILYYADTMEPLFCTNWGSPTFDSLDEVADYLNAAYDRFDCIDETEKVTIFEVFEQGSMLYIAAVKEDN